MKFWKGLVLVVVAVIAVGFLWNLLGHVIHFVLATVIPLALIGGGVYLVYRWATKDSRSLTGSRRELP